MAYALMSDLGLCADIKRRGPAGLWHSRL